MTACGRPSTGRPHSLRSWRLPDLFSYPVSLTTMTGSTLAGHRPPGSARRSVLRTVLLAQRGGAGPPLNRPPPPGAPRLLPPPRGGGQCDMICPARGIGEYPSGLFWGSGRSHPLRSKRGDSRRAARPRRASEGVRGPARRKRAGRCSEASTSEQGNSPIVGTQSDPTLPRPGRAGRSSHACRPTRPVP